jgi:hypothetical protein
MIGNVDTTEHNQAKGCVSYVANHAGGNKANKRYTSRHCRRSDRRTTKVCAIPNDNLGRNVGGAPRFGKHVGE